MYAADADTGGHVSPPRPEIVRLAADMEEAESIYSGIIGLTRTQSDILRSGDTDALVAVALQKETELTRVQDVEQRMAAIRALWGELQETLDPGEKKLVQQAAQRLEATLRELLALEEAQRRAILAQKEATLDDIQRLQAGRSVRQTYRVQGGRAATLLDRKE